MSILIKGMEMPTGNDVLIIGIDSEGKVYSVFRVNDIAGDVGLCDTGIGATAVPAADVRPVVLCQDCKHKGWIQEPEHGKSVDYCRLLKRCVDKQFFCAAGERKTNCGTKMELMPHAHWVRRDEQRGSYRFYCSSCGGMAYYVHGQNSRTKGEPFCGYPLCPNCGADMREEI